MNANLLAEYADALHAVLGDMGVAAKQLIAVLDEEREALQRADADALNRVGETKQLLMRQLEQLDVERLHLSEASATAAQHTDPAWRELLGSLAICRDKNQRNGTLVNLRLSLVRRALSALTGNDAQGANIYGQNGSVKGLHRSAPIAQA